jgi:hypothetical protein
VSITIKLCGQDVEIKTTAPGNWSAGGMGRSSTLDGEILLRAGMPDSVRAGTLLHEVVHFCLSANGFNEQSSNEQMVATLSNSLMAALRDNPQLVNELLLNLPRQTP